VHDDPARYALEHAHYVEDLEFWRDAARRCGGPVLDLGCAVGRVAIPLAQDGHEVWALDASEAMLAELRSRAAAAGAGVASRIHAVQGDMCGFALGRRFALVIVAMNTLQTLLAPDRQLACLRTVREHLAAGGELVFDVARADVADITSTLGVVRHMAEHHDPQTGTTLVHSAGTRATTTSTRHFASRSRSTTSTPGGGWHATCATTGSTSTSRPSSGTCWRAPDSR
jgi:SAM-dependent methyltransferase